VTDSNYRVLPTFQRLDWVVLICNVPCRWWRSVQYESQCKDLLCRWCPPDASQLPTTHTHAQASSSSSSSSSSNLRRPVCHQCMQCFYDNNNALKSLRSYWPLNTIHTDRQTDRQTETYFDDIDTDKNVNRLIAGKTSEQSRRQRAGYIFTGRHACTDGLQLGRRRRETINVHQTLQT